MGRTLIDPITIGIISGLIVEGIKGVVRIGRQPPDVLMDTNALQEQLEGDSSLSAIVENGATSLSTFETAISERQTKKLRNFLSSPEMESIVRQIYANQLNEEPLDSILAIRREFVATLSLHLGKLGSGYEALADRVFDQVLAGCDRCLSLAIDNGVLAAHEAKSSFRYRMLRDELAVIGKNIAFLTADQEPDIDAILGFEEQYRQQVANRNGTITPPYVDVAHRVPINDLYVPPNFVNAGDRDGEKPIAVRLELDSTRFLSAVYRAVLLGNPGSGKSTFAQKLCYDLSARYSERLLAGRLLTPILVTLRDYGAEKKAQNCSILQFIEMKANADHQLEPPSNAFKYMLLNGRAIVVFDGLDELLDTSYRQQISRDVESFSSLFPSVPVIVTSREVGYEQAPLDEQIFDLYRLSEFDEEQVHEYATKWFKAHTDLPPEQLDREAAAFIRESQIVEDLRANPLMLGLMCNLYRGENYIPKNRPDVYRKCAEMLFERWDRSRGIHYPLPFQAHVRPAMTYLAHWIYSDEALQGGVTEQQLVDKATEYLYPERFEDRDVAAMAAREFIEYCRGRAWVFTDTGTTRTGERLYQFTHRTFLEYFTAQYLARTYYTPERLQEVLLPRITNREWDIVAQLAVQIQSDTAAGAGDDFLSALVRQAEVNTDEKGWNLLSFAARCLQFIVPSASVRADITAAGLKRCIDWSSAQQSKRRSRKTSREEPRFGRYGAAADLLTELLNTGAENRTTVANQLEKTIVEYVNGNDKSRAIAALEIGLTLRVLASLEGRSSAQREKHEHWQEISERIFEACRDKTEAVAKENFQICFKAVWLRKLPARCLVDWHGTESLFRDGRFVVASNVRVISWAEALAYEAVVLPHGNLDEPGVENALRDIKDIANFVPSRPLPWFTRSSEAPASGFWHIELAERRVDEGIPAQFPCVDRDVFFGIFALFAAMLELDATDRQEESDTGLAQVIRQSQLPFFDHMRMVFLARFEQADPDVIRAEMEHCGFTEAQQVLTWQWIRCETNFVGTGT